MTEQRQLSRRDVLKGAAGAAVIGIGGVGRTDSATLAADMPRRVLGKTGYHVGLFSIGGNGAVEMRGAAVEVETFLNRALDLGVNYLDTAAAYHQGDSERNIGQVMKQRRKEVWLASKTDGVTYDACMRELESSLKNLQTDHLDCWQAHNIRTQRDLDRIFAKDGAVKAMEKAREQKLVRTLGITGHKDALILRKGIEQYPFDTVLMALNAADAHTNSFIKEALPVAHAKKMGIIGMKVAARGRIFRDGGITTMRQAMNYALTLPVSTVIIGISNIAEVEENAKIAREFKPLPHTEMAQLEELTRSYHEQACFFKTEF